MPFPWSLPRRRPAGRRHASRHWAYRPALETLERYELLATFLVNLPADQDAIALGYFRNVGPPENPTKVIAPDLYASGQPLTLRAAIQFANVVSGRDTIAFASALTIRPLSGLPFITDSVIVDGTTAPGFNPNLRIPIVELDGSLAGVGRQGFDFGSGNSMVRGLVINRFVGAGVRFVGSGATGNVVQGCYIGTDRSGTVALPNDAGVLVQDALGNTIGGAGQGNLISGNRGFGIWIYGSTSTGNVVQGNYIGTDKDGGSDLGNGDRGVRIEGASGNTIGGTTQGARNLISGNDVDGVFIVNGTGNLVQGNYIGTDAAGITRLGNTNAGVSIHGGSDNLIGGTTAAASNVIAANGREGIYIGNGTASNRVLGNYIGTDQNGGTALGNGLPGIVLDNSPGNTVGGAAPGAGNLISGNLNNGVSIYGAGATGNAVLGNRIGLSAAGAALGNGANGVTLAGGAARNTIGGTTVAARNVISGNLGGGVSIVDAATSANLVQGNYIGTNVSGTTALGNKGDGVIIIGGATGNTVGGTTAAARNVISNNGQAGVAVFQAATGNLVQGNYIGTDAAGTTALGNGTYGVWIFGGASGNTVGGTVAGARNVIAASTYSGVALLDAGTSGNLVQGNYIGTDVNGTTSLGNKGDGVQISRGASGNTVGGTTPATRNLISGNNSYGVEITSAGTTGNLVQGSYIGTSADGTAALGNARDGVRVELGASGNLIGGTTPGAGNLISGNNYDGVRIADAGTTGNLVQGNYIGTDVSGTAALGNKDSGVVIVTGPSNNTVGGTAPGAGNLISGNNNAGVAIGYSGTTGNVVQGNRIGTDATGTAALGNARDGVPIYGGASNNTVGGTTPSAGNLISGNFSGVSISDAGTTGNLVQGNFVGTDLSGTIALKNTIGINVDNNASGNTIGGTVSGAGNLISGNRDAGVIIQRGATGNLVQGNRIGTDAGGMTSLGNTASGVAIIDAPRNTVGGTTPGAGNLISGGRRDGVRIYNRDPKTPVGGGATGNVVQGNRIGTDANGTDALGNARDGVRIEGGATGNTVGGISVAARNVIAGNRSNGVHLLTAGTTGNLVLGNFVGLATDERALGNAGDGVLIEDSAAGNTVGGPAAGAGNTISANGDSSLLTPLGDGVRISGAGTSNNFVQGNRIGITATGSFAHGNLRDGVRIEGGAFSNTIGGMESGAGNTIAANYGSGVTLTDRFSSGNLIAGNRIGTDEYGIGAQPNAGWGVLVSGAAGNTIGGVVAEARNVISGNRLGGVALVGSEAKRNAVQGNRIGTNAAGTNSVGNVGPGIYVGDGDRFNPMAAGAASDNLIGGDVPDGQAGNLIAGNVLSGVVITGVGATGNMVQGNRIGTNADGTGPLANGQSGVLIADAPKNLVGGETRGAGNTISSNNGYGVALTGVATAGNRIEGNRIGTTADGSGALGNALDGVLVQTGGGNTIGGLAAGTGNTIGFNGGAGVDVRSGTGNAVLGNSIRRNGGLGIDLGGDGLTPNDPGDADTGPNNLQNFPVLSAVMTSAAGTTIRGMLNSTPKTTFRIEFFSNTAADPSGSGPGEEFIGAVEVTTDDAGNVSYTFTTAAPIGVGRVVTATATDPTGNTSEFSAPAATDGPVDVTTLVGVARGGYSFNRRTGRFVQAVTITNTGPGPIAGPISLVLDGLTPGVTLANQTGLTSSNTGQPGRPYINLLGVGESLAAGASVTIFMEFDNRLFLTIGYNLLVFGGEGKR